MEIEANGEGCCRIPIMRSNLVLSKKDMRPGLASYRTMLNSLISDRQYDGARAYFAEMLQSNRKGLGEERPDTLNSMDHLAAPNSYQD